MNLPNKLKLRRPLFETSIFGSNLFDGSASSVSFCSGGSVFLQFKLMVIRAIGGALPALPTHVLAGASVLATSSSAAVTARARRKVAKVFSIMMPPPVTLLRTWGYCCRPVTAVFNLCAVCGDAPRLTWTVLIFNSQINRGRGMRRRSSLNKNRMSDY